MFDSCFTIQNMLAYYYNKDICMAVKIFIVLVLEVEKATAFEERKKNFSSNSKLFYFIIFFQNFSSQLKRAFPKVT